MHPKVNKPLANCMPARTARLAAVSDAKSSLPVTDSYHYSESQLLAWNWKRRTKCRIHTIDFLFTNCKLQCLREGNYSPRTVNHSHVAMRHCASSCHKQASASSLSNLLVQNAGFKLIFHWCQN